MTLEIRKDNIVVQANNLIEAYYDTDLKPTEHKIIRYAIIKIKDNPSEFPTAVFTVQEFVDVTGVRGKSYYERFEKIADELSKKRIKLKIENQVGWIPWLSSLSYKDGIVVLTFNPLIKNMILDLEGGFTRYNYQFISDMRSPYTIRLYELLKQYAPIGRRKVKVDVLKNMLGIGDKYKQYGHFKARVLNQTKKELDEKDGLTFEFNEIKKGRRIDELEFIIKNNNEQLPNSNYNIEESMFIKEVEYLLGNYDITIKPKKILSWRKYGIDLINTTLEEIKNRDIKNYEGYIDKVLKAKYEESKQIKTPSNDYMNYVYDFIYKNKSNDDEIIPDWFIEQKFKSFVQGEIKDSEVIDMLWNQHKDYIIDRINN